jgi:hypothetical protein
MTYKEQAYNNARLKQSGKKKTKKLRSPKENKFFGFLNFLGCFAADERS